MSAAEVKPGPRLRQLLADPVQLLAFGLGAGLLRPGPGTFGTLWGLPLFLLMSQLAAGLYLLLTVALFAAGVWICGESARRLGVHDHSGIVWDEIVGVLVTLAPLHPDILGGYDRPTWLWLGAGFLVFRVLDIAKPPPIRWADRHIHGGYGIMLDDLLAGVLGAFILAALLHFLG